MTGLARVSMVVLLTCAVVGCSGSVASPTASTPTSTPTAPSATPTLQPTAVPTIDPDACPVPPQATVILAESSGFDANAGTARATLCIEGEAPITASFASCRWLADRESIGWVNGIGNFSLPSWGAGVRLKRDTEPVLTMYRGVVDDEPGASYASSAPIQLISAIADGGLSGAIRFEDLPRTDQNPVPTAPTTVSGLVRWACDEPPEPVPGDSTGSIALDADGRTEPVRIVDATCKWVVLDGSPVMLRLSTWGDAYRFGDLDAGVSINRNSLGAHELPEVFVFLDDGAAGGSELSATWRYPLSLTADQSSGALRFRSASYEPGSDLDGTPVFTAGIVTWHCDPPIAGPPKAPEGYEPHEAPLTTIGTGILRLGNPLDNDLPADVTCLIENGEIREVQVEATYGDERLTYTSMWDDGVLIRLDQGGQPLGEYGTTSGYGWFGTEPGAGPVRVPLGTAVFEPTDPRYEPLGGSGGPDRFELTITVDCPSA